MNSLRPIRCVLFWVVAAAACGRGEPTTPQVEVSVAPIAYPGIVDVCYQLTVWNGAPRASATEKVWSKAGLCSSSYGRKGEISNVGPCDANAAGNNYVELVLETIMVEGGGTLDDQYSDSTDDADFENPCPSVSPCALDFECVENRDVPVAFNLTIMRDAEQGFFDIALDFADVFCSAKLDCQYPSGPIELLHRPGGVRGQTAVLGFACTTGPGATLDTVLHMNSLVVTCGTTTTVLDPTVGPGAAYTTSAPDPDSADAIWQYATYYGVEALRCGTDSCNKLYWNLAIGFDPSFRDCSLVASATVSTTTQMLDALTPPATTYPWIAFEVPLTADVVGGGLVCDQNPVNESGSGVVTAYTPVTVQKPFCHHYDGGTPATAAACKCVPATCESIAAGSCGTFSDGCGSSLQCDCVAPETCGGGGVAGQCGCTPTICLADACGVFSDGCGGSVSCDPSTGPPRAIAKYGIVLPMTAAVSGPAVAVLPAATLDGGSYDLQTPSEALSFAVRLSETGVAAGSFTFDCVHLADEIQLVELSVTDQQGQTSRVETYVRLIDPEGVCAGGTSAAGDIRALCQPGLAVNITASGGLPQASVPAASFDAGSFDSDTPGGLVFTAAFDGGPAVAVPTLGCEAAYQGFAIPTVFVSDGQGNVATCESSFVTVHDPLGLCPDEGVTPVPVSGPAAPHVVLASGVVTTLNRVTNASCLPAACPGRGSLSLAATLFDRGSFDADTPASELIFKIRRADDSGPALDSLTFDCRTRDTQIVEVFVTDGDGNTSSATTSVLIQDNGNACNGCSS